MELLAAFEYRDVGITIFFSLHTRQVTLCHKGSFTNYAVTFGGEGLPKDDERVSMKHDERWGGGAEDDVIIFRTKIRRLLKKIHSAYVRNKYLDGQ